MMIDRRVQPAEKVAGGLVPIGGVLILLTVVAAVTWLKDWSQKIVRTGGGSE